MPKRSPWAAQPRRQKIAIRKKFAEAPTPPELLVLEQIAQNGPQQIPREKKIALLKANRPVVQRIIKSVFGGKGKRAALSVDKIIQSFEVLPAGSRERKEQETVLDEIAFRVLKEVTLKKRPAYSNQIQQHALDYLNARRFPVSSPQDADLARIAANRVASKKAKDGPLTFKEFFDLRELEREFVGARKSERALKHGLAELENYTFRIFASHFRLTPQQKITLRRSINRETQKTLEKLAKVTQSAKGDWTPEHEVAFRAMYDPVYDLVQSFFPKKSPKKSVVSVRENNAPKKTGTRSERLRAYVPNEKEEKAIQDFKATQLAARMTSTPFDAVRHALSEIRLENDATATQLEKLLRARRLSRGSVIRLFTAGSLTRRIFTEVLGQTDFERQFGSSSVETLAKMLAYIGPRGREIQRTLRSFPGQGQKIFDFLEKKGVLETQHTGAHVVYLRR